MQALNGNAAITLKTSSEKLLAPLQRLFVAPPSDEEIDSILDGGLLPPAAIHPFENLIFLCFTVLPAQRAQRLYGVRASILLALAMYEHGYQVCRFFKGRKLNPASFEAQAKICRWFFEKAQLLTEPEYREALKAGTAKECFLRLASSGFILEEDVCDYVDLIGDADLERCDLAGWLPEGDYSSERFDDVKDESGRVTGVRPSEFHAMLCEKKASGRVACID